MKKIIVASVFVLVALSQTVTAAPVSNTYA